MKTETIVSITVTLHYYHNNTFEVKKTIHRFVFDEDSDQDSEIKKFVHESLNIEEFEAYNSYEANPKRKQKCLGIRNNCGGHERLSYVEIQSVIENEWTDE
jgi:hypothetical protein